MKKIAKFGVLALLSAVTVFTSSCSSDGPDKVADIKMESNLAGSKEVPVRTTTSATGRMEGVYNKETKTLNFSITYSGLTPTAGHFHIGDEFQNGPVVYTFSSLQSPITGSWKIEKDDYANRLLSGQIYVNLHSKANPSGEIRGTMYMSDFLKKYNLQP